MSGLEPPTSLDWLPAYSNQLNYTAPFLVFYIATLVAILIVYPTIPAAPGCPWSPHFLVPTQYTLALWYRHFLSFLDAVRYGGVCVKLSKSVEGGGFGPPAAFSFLIVGRADSNRRSSKASGTTASRPVCETFNHSPYSLWLHHLPAFCPMSRAPHGGR